MKATTFAAFLTLAVAVNSPRPSAAQVQVRGHFCSDGTCVRPHTRSHPCPQSPGPVYGRWIGYGGYTHPGGASAPPVALIQPRRPLDETTREWADAIRERWKLQDEARERRAAEITARRDAYFRYRSTREPQADGTFTYAGVRYPSYQAFTSSPAALELRRRAQQEAAQEDAATLAAAQRYQQLIREDVREQRLRASGYAPELYPDRR